MSSIQMNIKRSDSGVVFNAEFEDLIRRNSLLDFDRVMSLNEGEVVKHAVPERKTVRFCLKNANGPVEAYLKRLYPLSLTRFFAQILKLSVPRTAFDEFINITAFHRAGLPTMIPVAAGRRRCGLFRTESFLVTKSIEGCRRLDDFFSRLQDVPVEDKRELIKKVALLVKKMHECGFNHRDLYLCHILLDSKGGLFLADLHRVDKRGKVPERWKVKDVAALNYSAPWHRITRTDRLWFLKNYLGTNRLSGGEKLFVLKVLKKTEKMVKHNEKKSKVRIP